MNDFDWILVNIMPYALCKSVLWPYNWEFEFKTYVLYKFSFKFSNLFSKHLQDNATLFRWWIWERIKLQVVLFLICRLSAILNYLRQYFSETPKCFNIKLIEMIYISIKCIVHIYLCVDINTQNSFSNNLKLNYFFPFSCHLIVPTNDYAFKG